MINNSTELRQLLETILKFRNEGAEWVESLNSDIRPAFYENKYVNSILMEIDVLLKLAVGDKLIDDVEWFLYEWKPGFTIQVDDQTYEINNLNDFMHYLVTTGIIGD